MTERFKIRSIEIKGFKSICSKKYQSIPLADVTVLIGANGSGKSNFVSFWKLINEVAKGNIQEYVIREGGANSILYYGAKETGTMDFYIFFSNPIIHFDLYFRLALANGDQLQIIHEQIDSDRRIESMLSISPNTNNNISMNEKKEEYGIWGKLLQNPFLQSIIEKCKVFQFHDSSSTSRMRLSVNIDDNRYLHSDAGNLAAYLYALKSVETDRPYYDRIIRHIQSVMPQFKDFELLPERLNDKMIKLNYFEKGSDYLFGPHQLSDGSLRFIALATLLLAPPKDLPSVIVIDEPELGLHPTAIGHLASMAKKASEYSQVILATQSPRLVDEFTPNNIVVVERDEINHCSVFKQLKEEELKDWLDDYSLSELWDKNVLGGLP